MFKKFSQAEVQNANVVKSSAQRAVRQELLEHLKVNQETLEQIWPKKEPLTQVKCRERIVVYTLKDGVPLFFQQDDGPLLPTLHLLQKYPSMLPLVKVDRGAIRFLLSGVNMMCPGFTSKGGYLPPVDQGLPSDTPVAIFAEGKEHPAAIGILKMSTEEIKAANKGIGVEVKTYLGDGLWATPMLGKR